MPFCPECGKELSVDSKFCNNCGKNLNAEASDSVSPQATPPQAHIPQEYVDNHLPKAIFTMILCCMPLGIVSTVYASSVNGKLRAGDVVGAREAAEKADTWANWAIGLGIIMGIINVLIILATADM